MRLIFKSVQIDPRMLWMNRLHVQNQEFPPANNQRGRANLKVKPGCLIFSLIVCLIGSFPTNLKYQQLFLVSLTVDFKMKI